MGKRISVRSKEKMQELLKLRWPTKCYTQTRWERGNIFKEKGREYTLIIVDSKDYGTNEIIETTTNTWPITKKIAAEYIKST